MSKCFLCNQNADLQKSHIIPSFVGKWLKDTSVTGYLRQAVNANLRRQDLLKEQLLCKKCELQFSFYEDRFSREIFYPYVNKELDEWGVAKGELIAIKYEEWLLKFIISLQWRSLITYPKDEKMDVNELALKKYKGLTDKAIKNWSDYLQGKSEGTGKERHYIIFLQNLSAGTGSLPDRINDRVNTYLLRSVDSTLGYSNNNLFLFTKMGPIVIISGLKPYELPKMTDIIIHKKGILSTIQHLRNNFINEFIFITRPNEAFSASNISDIQKNKIATDITNRIKTAEHKQDILALYSDYMLKKRKSAK